MIIIRLISINNKSNETKIYIGYVAEMRFGNVFGVSLGQDERLYYKSYE